MEEQKSTNSHPTSAFTPWQRRMNAKNSKEVAAQKDISTSGQPKQRSWKTRLTAWIETKVNVYKVSASRPDNTGVYVISDDE